MIRMIFGSELSDALMLFARHKIRMIVNQKTGFKKCMLGFLKNTKLAPEWMAEFRSVSTLIITTLVALFARFHPAFQLRFHLRHNGRIDLGKIVCFTRIIKQIV